MKTYKIYIGSNNNTHKCEKNKIINIISQYHLGFTIIDSLGYWQGVAEQSCIVELADNDKKVLKTIKILKRVLKQEAIAYSVEAELVFI